MLIKKAVGLAISVKDLVSISELLARLYQLRLLPPSFFWQAAPKQEASNVAALSTLCKSRTKA